MASSSVPNLYYSVIEDVIANVREAFIDEGVDEQALTELKQVWEKKLHESKAIEREPETAVSKNVTQTTLQPVQQQTNLGPSASITHQLAMPPTNLVPQTLLQYTTPASGDVQKTMALNLPQKLTLTVPAHLAQSGLQTLVTAPGTTAVQLPPELASLFQGNVIASTHSSNLQHGGQQITGVHYQTLTSEQLKNAQQFTVTIPVTTPQSQASVIGQIDGTQDTSDEDDEDDFPDNDDDRDDNDDEQNEDDIGEEDEVT
ncbi:transcription initiation factor IIA subunit 1-like [Stegodyphus dumicola]|nr:transcription initiation factor IIA subunit 1-like [Stegodyphus dumicola]